MEKPMRTGPPCFADRPVLPWSGPLTHALNSNAVARHNRIILTLDLISLRPFSSQVCTASRKPFVHSKGFSRGPDVYIRTDRIIQAISSSKITNEGDRRVKILDYADAAWIM
jgi:hypothetical protein